MRAASRFSMLSLGLAVLLGLSSAAISLADDAAPAAPATPAAATGTLSGKVLDATGNPAKGVHVSAYAVTDDAPAKGKKMPPAVATADTGDDGTYKLTAVPAGKVRVIARLDTNMGRAKGELTVTAGQDTKVDDITLAPAKQHKGKNAPAAAAPAGN